MRFFHRLFRQDPPTAEELFEETVGIGPLPRGEDHPVYNDAARDALARDLARASGARLFARIESARASGKWTDEMQAIWDQLGATEPPNEEEFRRLDSDLKRLLAERGE